MEVLPNDAFPYLFVISPVQILLPGHSRHRPVHRHVRNCKALAGQGIKPAGHVGKQEMDNLFLLLGHLFIMHEGHLLSGKRKGNFSLLYTRQGEVVV